MHFKKNISLNEFSDIELAAQYKQSGDLNLLGSLFQRHMHLVYGVCLKYLKDPDNAQDHTMAIFEELVEKLRKHDVNNFKSWLHVLAKNHCLMHLRSEKKSHTVPLEEKFMQNEAMEHLFDEIDNEQIFIQLDYCMDQLAPEQKLMMQLFYIDGKCYNEIVLITGLEWKKIRSSIQNGRRNLKICMEKQKEKPTVQ